MDKFTSNIVIGTTLLLAVGAVAGHFFGEPFLRLLAPASPVELSTTEQQVAPAFAGTLLMTMKAADDTNARSGIYRIPVNGGNATLENDSADFYAPSLSNDGSRAVVVANTENAPAQLLLTQLTDINEAEIIAPPAPTVYAGASDWSPDDAYVAYTAMAPLTSEDDPDIAHSYVVLLDVETREQVIVDQGASPVFADDGSIIYVKHDGVYRIVTDGLGEVGDPERLFYFDGYEATRYMSIALSPDNTTLVVANPSESTLTAYTVGNVDGAISLTELGRMTRSAFWPTFSPDGRHLAYIAAETVEGAARMSIVVVDSVSGTERIVKDVSAFEESSLSLTGWLE